MKYEIKNRWSGNVQFAAEIECAAYLGEAVKIGLALKWGFATGARLVGASLDGASLDGALEDGALEDGLPVNASSKVFRSFKADLWLTLSTAKAEVTGLLKALKEGRVDGSQYEGECACLVGTIDNVRGVNYGDLQHNADNPAERWFAMIRKGDKPGVRMTSGGFASRVAVDWIEEWCALNRAAVSA